MSRPENWRGSVQAPRVPQLGQASVVEVDLVGVDARRTSSPLAYLLLEVVGAEALVAGLALGQRVREGGDVAAGLPGLARQDHEESRPTMSSRCCTMELHHWRLMFSFSSTPSGP